VQLPPPRSRPPRRGPRKRIAPPPRSTVAGLPSGERTNSASLEATPRLTELVTHLLTCPSDKCIKCQPLHRRARVGRCQAAMPHSGCDRGPVRQLRSLLRHPQHCSGTLGICDALHRRVRHCSCHCAAYSAYFLRCGTLGRHGRDPRTRSGPGPEQDPLLQDPRRSATPRLEDSTLHNNRHDAHWSHKVAGAISARSGHRPGQRPRPAP